MRNVWLGSVLFVLATLTATACGPVDNSTACAPACSGGTICCNEPTHASDGGAASAPACVAPSSGVCPVLP